jgi:Protein of unknown function (DUF1579)
MKKFLRLLSLLAATLISARLSAQSQEEMKAYTAYMTPGPIQEMMAKSVGSWTGTVSMWPKEGVPPMTSALEITNEMILGGRFLKGTNKGTMYGMPFEGIGITGYDNAKQIFANSWIDNMGTGIIFMEGSWDAAANSINFSGKSTDPLTKKDIPTREVLKFVDDNHQVFEMYITVNGKEFKYLEIKYLRK